MAFAAVVGAVLRGAGPGGPAPSRAAARTYGWSVTAMAVVLAAVAVIGAVVALTLTPLGVPAAAVAAGFVLLGYAAAGAVVRRRTPSA